MVLLSLLLSGAHQWLVLEWLTSTSWLDHYFGKQVVALDDEQVRF